MPSTPSLLPDGSRPVRTTWLLPDLRPLARSRAVAVLLLWLGAAASGRAQEGGIGIFSGETLFGGGTRFTVSHLFESRTDLYDGSSTQSDPSDADRYEHRAVLAIDHGMHRHLTVSALIPYVNKSQDQTVGGQRQRLDSSGLGDIALLAKVGVHKTTWPRGAFTVALIGGLEVPLGRTDVRDGGQRLPTKLQPGSGSWDPFASVATTIEQDRWRFDGRVFGKWNSSGARRFDDSDVLSLELSAAYRFVHEPYPGPSHNFRLGVVARHLNRARERGDLVHDSGADLLILRPVLTLHPNPRIDIVFAVDLPLWQSYRGRQLGLDSRSFAAFGVRF